MSPAEGEAVAIKAYKHKTTAYGKQHILRQAERTLFHPTKLR
jgi:hypothetical protein